jgi:hypothetical protein
MTLTINKCFIGSGLGILMVVAASHPAILPSHIGVWVALLGAGISCFMLGLLPCCDR